MTAMKQGDFAVHMSGADVVWEPLSSADIPLIAPRLTCRVCGTEVAVRSGSGWPSCCNQPMRRDESRMREPALRAS